MVRFGYSRITMASMKTVLKGVSGMIFSGLGLARDLQFGLGMFV
jgi:hypothetical protein